MRISEHRNSRPQPKSNRLADFLSGAPLPLIIGILVPAVLTCSRPNGQDLLMDWQRQLVSITYYTMCMVYLFLAFKNAMDAKYPRALAYLLAPISAGIITATKPDSCIVLNHWRDVIMYETGLRNLF